MMKRIDNLEILIEQMNNDTLLAILSINKHHGIDWDNFTWDNPDMKKIKGDIINHFKDGSLKCLESIEEFICKTNYLGNIMFSEELKMDMEYRCSDWMTPFISILTYYGYSFKIDYIEIYIQYSFPYNQTIVGLFTILKIQIVIFYLSMLTLMKVQG